MASKIFNLKEYSIFIALMRYKLLAACALSIYFLASCNSKPVDVVLDQAAEDSLSHKILVDGKTLFNLKGDTTLAIKLVPGRHFLQINDSAKREFTVSEKGGIVNLNNSEYVVYEVKYTSGGASGLPEADPFRMKSAILIDSFVIIPKTRSTPADSALRALIPKLMKKQSTANTSLSNENVRGLKLIGKDQFFIEKFWDYSMTDSIPETMQVQTNKYVINDNIRTKTSIVRSGIFLLSVLLSDQDEYIVKSLHEIREGKEDKEKVKEQESKQMEF
jgi:hypothetical protein